MEDGIALIDKLINEYGNTQEALVEILRDMNEVKGYLNQEDLAIVAERLRLPQSKVFSVASFYSLISVKPLGKHVVRFCEDAPCHVVGGKEIWDTLEKELGIPFGATSFDGQWSLLTTSCIGTCSVGPVMTVDGEIYGHLTPDKVHDIITQYRKKDKGGTA